MTRVMRRRDFLLSVLSCAGTFAASTRQVVADGLACTAAGKCRLYRTDDTAQLLDLLDDSESWRRFGSMCTRTKVMADASIEELAVAISAKLRELGDIHGQGRRYGKTILRRAICRDYEMGRTKVVAGWLVSELECQLSILRTVLA